MSVQTSERKLSYPSKVMIPDEYLVGNPHAEAITSLLKEYYFYRDLLWELLLIEKVNPYTKEPYFQYTRESEFNHYDWHTINYFGKFSYKLYIPDNRPGNYQTCYLDIDWYFKYTWEKTFKPHDININFYIPSINNMDVEGTNGTKILSFSPLNKEDM